ncbi:MAG: DNA topoisomerase IV subunit A [Planctomycetes bacterium]|nr:DNA topoisomerase IV subunit A [Planctomycetota bacterium]MCB9889966.1 DNA topoisomerase IV subunit A [Planctomycetota bacterium]
MAAKKSKASKQKSSGGKAPTTRTPPKARTAKNPLTKVDKVTIQQIDDCAKHVYTKIIKLDKPSLKFPVRALSNVRYDQKVGHFQLGRSRKERTLTKGTVKSFAQTLKLMALSKEMVVGDDFATKREAYYVSKNWGQAKFAEQPESDACMDDIEALFSLEGLSREQLRFYPEEHGGAVAGALVVIDKDSDTGADIRIDCTGFGSGAYSIPHSVEHLRFETRAQFIIAIETGGMFQRLNKHKFWQTHNCILVETMGVPTRATRRFIRKLSDDKKIPVYAFVDCDPYGISNIYRTLKVGSGNAAHLNQFFCVPQARYLGVTPQDILDFQLQDATHPLVAVDIKRAKDALKNDPFFKAHKSWQKAIDQMLTMGVRAEQQALAKWGLNFVVEEYLPRKLKETGKFLP